MPLSPPSLRRFVRRALVDATGVAAPDRGQIASAFDSLSERLRGQLQPVFGTVAVGALFVRAVQVAAQEFPWLRTLVPTDGHSSQVDRMADLAALEIHTLEEGLAAVLAHIIQLLIGFVGEDLVLPLVQHAWGVADAPRAGGQP